MTLPISEATIQTLKLGIPKAMLKDSGKLYHVGINFNLAPPPGISHQSFIAFQSALISEGLEYDKTANEKGKIAIFRERVSPLEITIFQHDSRVGQFLVLASNPTTTTELFIDEAEAAVNAFERVWPSENRQIISTDATIRRLYPTTSDHAFQELWEDLLGQSKETLAVFERPIRGGGLRFVLDPKPSEANPVQIEIKIESFLSNTSMIYVETQFNWMAPGKPGEGISARERIHQINKFVDEKVFSFLEGAQT